MISNPSSQSQSLLRLSNNTMKISGASDSDDPERSYTETIFTMSILVKTPSNKEEVTLFTLKSSDTISHLKTLIKIKEGVPRKRQILVHNGKMLQDHDTLSTCCFESWSVVCAIFCPAEIICPKMDGAHMFVKMSGWTEPVSMEVKPWYTGREVKAVMESATGMFLDEYVVSYGGKIIQDSVSFCKCNMNKEMPIYLLSSGKTFRIVARGCGWEELIVVCESYTVRDVKKMVENFAQVKPERQVLFRGGDDTVGLDDDEKPLAFYDVVDKSTIWVLGLALKLTIKMPQAGDVVILSAYKINTVKHIKAHICEKMGIPCSSQKLFYKGTFLADEADSLEAYNMEGANCVIFATFGSGDDDEQVKDLEKIKLTFKGDSISHSIELEVECSTYEESESESDGEESEGEIFKLKLKSSNTMLDVKTVIQSQLSFPVCSQQLYSDETLLKDWRNLWDYNITKWLFMSSPLIMFIETPNHKKVVIEASNINRVREILDMIPQEALDNISWKPSLFLEGNVILEHKTLAQCGVQSGSVLWLDRLVQIDVSGPNGATTHVNVNLSYTIKAVKEKIEQECGIPIGLQRLIYGGDELNDDMTIGQYEKVLGSLWALRWNFCGSSWSFFYPSYQVNKL